MDEKTILIAAIVILAGVVVLFASCAGEQYGSLRPSATLSESFQSSREDPNLEYYWAGPESDPLAVIGVERRLRFDSARHWMKIDPGGNRLKQLTENMRSNAPAKSANLQGYEIVDHRGECVGAWYSAVGVRAVIKRTGTDSVEIWPPSPEKPKP